MKLNSIAAVALASAASCGTTIAPGYKGLLDAPFSGGLQHTVYDNGFHAHSPFSSMITFDVTWTTTTEEIDVITAEGLHLRTLVALRYRPVQSELYDLVTDVGTNYYDEVLGPEFRTATRGEFANFRYLDITTHNGDLEDAIEREIRQRIAGKHLEIDSVTIEHVDYPDEIAEAIKQKLVVSQEADKEGRELDLAQKKSAVDKAQADGAAISAMVKAQSDAAVAKVGAQAQAEQTRLLAQADADARRLRAQADADAARLIGAQLSQQSLAYRGLEALEKLGGSGAKFYFFPGQWSKLPLLLTGP